MLAEFKKQIDERREAQKAPSNRERLSLVRKVLIGFLKGGTKDDDGVSRRKIQVKVKGENCVLEVASSWPSSGELDDGTVYLNFSSKRDGLGATVSIPTHNEYEFGLDSDKRESLVKNLDLMSKDVLPLIQKKK